MSERGVFAVDRGIFEHPAFQREPFTQREAWLWLVSEAAFKERSKRADGKVINLQRGQLCHSIRFMAEAWQWSKSRVDRFLTMLENRDMLRSETGTRTPIITICNYSEYQRVSLPERDKSGTTSGTRAGQERDKLESTENTEIPSETTSLREPRAERASRDAEKRTPVKRAHRLPPDWWPDEALRAYARGPSAKQSRLPGRDREIQELLGCGRREERRQAGLGCDLSELGSDRRQVLRR